MGLQLFGVASSYPPEICQGPVGPEKPSIGHLIQLGDPHSILICRDMLCHNIHGNFAQIQVGADTCRSRDSDGLKHIQDHPPGQLRGAGLIGFQIIGDVHKYLINGIDVDILRSNIFQIDLIDFSADLHIFRHLRRRCYIIQL